MELPPPPPPVPLPPVELLPELHAVKAVAATRPNRRMKPANIFAGKKRRLRPAPRRNTPKTLANAVSMGQLRWNGFTGANRPAVLVLATVSVTFVATPEVRTTDPLGAKLHVVFAGRFEQVRVTVPVNPVLGESTSFVVPDPPCGIVSEAGLASSVKFVLVAVTVGHIAASAAASTDPRPVA